MSEKAKAPAIRFKGFTDVWEQHKVSELLEERNFQAPKNGEYPLMAFVAYEGVAPKGDRYNREFLVSDGVNKKYKRTELGDFIYSSNNLTTGSIGLNKYGNASISPVYSIFHPTEIADSDFIGRSFIREEFINKMIRWRQGVIYGQWRIHESDFLEIETHVPSVEEQKKIGKIFDGLDNLITLHQRKLFKLTNVKKAMLEKMFPKSGSDVPEIRFSGFTDAWEQRKLGENASFLKGQGYSKKDLVENGAPIILYGRLYTNYESTIREVSTFVESTSNSIISKGNEVIVPASGETAEDIARASAVEKSGIILGGDLNIIYPEENIDSTFLALSISSGQVQRELSTKAQGKSVVHLRNPDIKDLEIYFPTKDEQRKISTYFDKVDNLITLHQRKLEKLKNLKKACLEKMFV